MNQKNTVATKFFTNQDDNSLFNKFEGVTNRLNLHHFDALVGYLRASGYFKVRKFLDSVPKVRILVGINVDKLIQEAQNKGLEFFKGQENTKLEFLSDVRNDIEQSRYSSEIEEGIIQFVADIIEGKLEIKAHPTRKLHAKIYIFREEELDEDTPCRVITGSSNFTDSGLGTKPESNYEFNVELRDYVDVKYAFDEFERLWGESVNILPIDIQKVKKNSYLFEQFTPYELYIKLLMEYFGKRIDFDTGSIDLLIPEKYKKLAYQSDAALEGYEKLKKYNGFILADVVGLGKTVVACIIIKKFILENGQHTKVLVVFPPALENNWRKAVNDFGIKNNIEFITTGSLEKIISTFNLRYSNPGAFDMVVIDESHKFRNDTSNMYALLQKITKSPRNIPGVGNDRDKKIMLLSATPLNNSPADIENQLYLFLDKRNSKLDTVKDLQTFFKPLKDNYKDLKKDEQVDIPKIKAIFDKIRDKVIEPLVIRRTRTDILENETYRKDIETQNIIFPDYKGPYPVRYEFDDDLSQLFFDTIQLLTGIDEMGQKVEGGLGYYRYRAIEYLKFEEDSKKHGQVKSVSERLAGIMKTMLIKRLESSFYAFERSLGNLLRNTEHMIKMFEGDQVFVAPDVDVNKFINDDKVDELIAKINDKGGNNRIYTSDRFEAEFVELLKADKAKIEPLLERWKRIDEDPKLDKFLADLKGIFLDKNKNVEGKLVIFSEANDTVQYLKKQLNAAGFDKVLAINAANRNKQQNNIKLNFDANEDEVNWKHDYDIIITTEVLAEGINLHRSNTIINYDVPWNSTRLMQRIGRVNRIGTRAKYIYIYNFYPTDQANNQIKLTDTAIKKLQAFHTAFGEDNQIYSTLEEVGEAGMYGANIKDEANETLKLLEELQKFRKEQPDWYKRIRKIPKRARICRQVEAVTQSPVKLPNTTISYLKSANHPGIFYHINELNQPEELTFLQAAKIFKSKENETAAADMPEFHHNQVNIALEEFTYVRANNDSTKIEKTDLSSAENKAIGQLSQFKKHSQNDDYKEILTKAIEALETGAYADLSKRANKFFDKNTINDIDETIENLLQNVLSDYHFKSAEEEYMEATNAIFAKPEIVISTSFNEA